MRDARAEGNVARSDIFAGFVAAALATEALFALVDIGIDRWLALQAAAFVALTRPDRIAAWLRLMPYCMASIAAIVGMLALLALIAAVFAAWVCGGLSIAPKAIKPSFKRLNAVRHVKSLFGARNLTAVALALTTAGVVGATSCWLLRERLAIVDAMIAWQSLSFDLRAGVSTLHAFVRALLAALFVPAVLSVIIAKRQHRRSLHMTHRELKHELKQTSGDPSMRARQRATFTEAVLATPPVRRGSGTRALIMNPEHVAVLLHYGGDESEPPIVIDKAIDDDAMRMANDALLERVAVFRFRQLARHLYRHGELQAAIPADCYRAVALVFRIVEEIEALTERPNTPIEIDDVAFES
jgi:flagellar biosynthesis protein FlhB